MKQKSQATFCSTLRGACAGCTYRIKSLSSGDADQLRLMELGFTAGELVSVLHRAPFDGLMKVMVKQTRFAICAQQAGCIEIEAA